MRKNRRNITSAGVLDLQGYVSLSVRSLRCEGFNCGALKFFPFWADQEDVDCPKVSRNRGDLTEERTA
jgi:hypothetical protein